MKFHLSRRYIGYPDSTLLANFSKLTGNARFVYNHFLSLKKIEYSAWVSKGRPKKFKWTNYSDWAYDLVNLKCENPWLQISCSQSLQQVLRHLSRSFDKFFKGGGGYPKFKNKYARQSLHFPNNAIKNQHLRVSENGKWLTITLPKNLGVIRCKISQTIPQGRHLRVVVYKDNDSFQVSIVYEVEPSEYHLYYPSKPYKRCGVDLGIKQPVVISFKDGNERIATVGIKTRKRLHKIQKRRRRLQKRVSKRQVRYNAQAQKSLNLPTHVNLDKVKAKVAKLYKKERNTRDNLAHQTSHLLASNFRIIKFENLNTQGMTRNQGSKKESLNREMLNIGWGKIIFYTQYKTARYGGRVLFVDPKYTSQTCFKCGCISKDNRLSQSKFWCTECGHRTNADENAARNIRLKVA